MHVSVIAGPETSAQEPQNPHHGAAGAKVLDMGGRFYPGVLGNVQGLFARYRWGSVVSFSPGRKLVCHLPPQMGDVGTTAAYRIQWAHFSGKPSTDLDRLNRVRLTVFVSIG